MMRSLLSALLALGLLSCANQDSPGDSTQLETITFQEMTIRDSIPGAPALANSPQAVFRADYLLPDTGFPDLDRFVDSIIRIGLSGDSINSPFQDITAAITNQKNLFFEDYRFTIAEGLKDGWIDTTEISVSLNYDESIVMEKVYNDKGILTLAYQMYSYTGGAHGNYGTKLQAIDLKKRKLLQWNDVFTIQKDNQQLSILLNEVARSYLELKEEEDLAAYLFEDSIEPNDNFGLSKEGVIFIYVPYEIAPYSIGEVELLLPYGQINEMLKPEYRLVGG